MGLHQMIFGRTLALPCDCDAEDDHGPSTDEPEAIQATVDAADEAPAAEFDDVWTDGSE